MPFWIGVEVGGRVVLAGTERDVGEIEGGFLGETVGTGVTGGVDSSTFVGEDVGTLVLGSFCVGVQLVGEEYESLVVGFHVEKLVGERVVGMLLVGRGVAMICSPLSFSNKESSKTALSDCRLSLVRTTGKTTMRMIATVPRSNSGQRRLFVMMVMMVCDAGKKPFGKPIKMRGRR